MKITVLYHFIFNYNLYTSIPQLPASELQHHTSACQLLMSQSNSKFAAQDWQHFDIFSVCNTKMISITKYDGSFAPFRQLRILIEELKGQLRPSTQLERANTRLKSRVASQAKRIPEIVRILAVENIGVATVEDKSIFIRLLNQEFFGNSHNIIMDKKASTEISNLIQKEDEDLYLYYCHIESLLKRIHRRDQVINFGRNTVMLSLLINNLSRILL